MKRTDEAKEGGGGDSPSQLIDSRIVELGDWRGETLARMRTLILEADPEMIEERKWRKPSNEMVGIPVWSHNGIVCTGETYRQGGQADLCQGRLVIGDLAEAFQLQPRGEHEAGHRLP